MKRTSLVSFFRSFAGMLGSTRRSFGRGQAPSLAHAPAARALTPQLRARLAKVALACSVLALVATSAPPEWHVEDQAREPFTFVSGQPSKQVTSATVIYRTPRGTWPFSVTHDVHLGALDDVRSQPAAARDSVSADSVVFEQTSQLDDRTRLSTKTSSENAFEVVCTEAQCEGSLEIDLSITWSNPLPPPAAGATLLADAGAGFDPPMVTLRASFFGGSDKPMFGCDAKDSSNDLEDAPKKLGVDVTMLPFQSASSGAVVPGAPSVDASVALPTPVGLDASLASEPSTRADAGL